MLSAGNGKIISLSSWEIISGLNQEIVFQGGNNTEKDISAYFWSGFEDWINRNSYSHIIKIGGVNINRPRYSATYMIIGWFPLAHFVGC